MFHIHEIFGGLEWFKSTKSSADLVAPLDPYGYEDAFISAALYENEFYDLNLSGETSYVGIDKLEIDMNIDAAKDHWSTKAIESVFEQLVRYDWKDGRDCYAVYLSNMGCLLITDKDGHVNAFSFDVRKASSDSASFTISRKAAELLTRAHIFSNVIDQYERSIKVARSLNGIFAQCWMVSAEIAKNNLVLDRARFWAKSHLHDLDAVIVEAPGKFPVSSDFECNGRTWRFSNYRYGPEFHDYVLATMDHPIRCAMSNGFFMMADAA